MARLAESTEYTTLVALGGELARTHDVNTLSAALSTRLNINGHNALDGLIGISAREEDKGPYARAALFTNALVGRLHVDGRSELACAVVSLLSRGPVEVDPVLWLNEAYGRIAIARESASRARARGHHKQADDLESFISSPLRSTLVDRLQADGHNELATAISVAWLASQRQERHEREAPVQPSVAAGVAAGTYAPPPELVGLWDLRAELGRTHAADILAYALVSRLRAEGREILAGSVMMFWAREHAGPMVDPVRLAVELDAQLRIEGRGVLADTIASVLRGASIARDPWEIMLLWLKELAGPIVDAGPLAAATIAALRKEKHGGLAAAVAALMNISPGGLGTVECLC